MKNEKLRNNRKYYNLLYILPLFVFMMAFMLVPFITGIANHFINMTQYQSMNL